MTVSEQQQSPADQRESTATQTEGSDADQVQIVTFEVGEEEFAVDILAVQEIIRVGQITRVPHSPPSVEGAVNFRGQITPVVDLRRRFGFDTVERGKDARIVIIEIHERIVGFLVDRVHEVLRINGNVIDPAPTLGNTIDSDYVRGVAKLDDRLIILLELDRLFGQKEVTAADHVSDAPA
jgi:purine-binding chemotaxis protein CheW